MKYVIKEDKSNPLYIGYRPLGRAFDFVADLEAATKFSSIADALDAIQERTREHVINIMPKLTIVGVKEAFKTTYEEVVL